MSSLLLLAWGLLMVLIARRLCGRWVNHLSVYSFVWTLSLESYETRLIAYNYISGEAWIFIFAAWIALYLGTMSAGMLVSGRPRDASCERVASTDDKLRSAIIILSCAGFVSSAILAWNIVHSLDSQLFLALANQGNSIYSMRFEGELSGGMYIGFLPYAASALAGAYVARTGRITLVSLLPLLAITIDGVLSMQRGGILIAIILFIAGIYLAPSRKPLKMAKKQMSLALGMLVAGFLYVTMTRGMPAEFESQGPILNRISDVAPSFPSLYMYLSAPPAGLSAYLERPEADGNAFWGRYTFAPAYRLLAKFGWNTNVPYYAEFYSTPVPINTCTYLREIYSDFGSLGVLAVPFWLGALITFLECRRQHLSVQMLLAHLYVVILFSFTLFIVVTGYWYISMIVSVLVGFVFTRYPTPADYLAVISAER